MKDDITALSIKALTEAFDKREVSSVEATKACLARIKNSDLNNYITVCESEALSCAEKADESRKNGEGGPLTGVPIAVKDNISTEGVLTTCASKFLQNYVPPFDATVVEKLKKAGAVIIGKTNLDEFAMGSTNENSAFGAVKNVKDKSRVPGGSSGGSANAVASFEAYAALGSDTGGSIRQPASYCGVVGLKPTYSAVSRYGLVAFASSLDQIGPLARTTDDALTVLKAIVGRDSLDTTSANAPALPAALDGNIKGKTIGVAEQFLTGADKAVAAQFDKAIAAAEKLGARIKKVSISSFDAALAVYYVISSAEAASNLSRYDGVKYGMRADKFSDIADLYTKSRTAYFGSEVKRRIMIGNYVLSSGYYDAYYLKASKVRTVIMREFDAALSGCDGILCPTAPTVAPKIGAQTTPAETYLSDVYTVPVNIAGLPAVSVPFGEADGLPVGVQVIGKAFDEGGILNIAKALEVSAKGGAAC
ncbi:MAG: Asp-tRNA(Asn)/Glu-tRNA(Gln) amidotransferase subunit GatA [Clostridiales bacterium]|nr:Asp-tRNA(Asn)/Glu-tRNA(Gln) amidotransferase subunit GatA [Clostridiales bacterium]